MIHDAGDTGERQGDRLGPRREGGRGSPRPAATAAPRGSAATRTGCVRSCATSRRSRTTSPIGCRTNRRCSSGSDSGPTTPRRTRWRTRASSRGSCSSPLHAALRAPRGAAGPLQVLQEGPADLRGTNRLRSRCLTAAPAQATAWSARVDPRVDHAARHRGGGAQRARASLAHRRRRLPVLAVHGDANPISDVAGTRARVARYRRAHRRGRDASPCTTRRAPRRAARSPPGSTSAAAAES